MYSSRMVVVIGLSSLCPIRAHFLAEAVVDPALLHDGVGGVAGLDLTVHGDVTLGDGTVPDIVISFAVPDERAGVGGKDFPDGFLVFCHYMATCS